jgi:glucose/arabinose dehydrogenase/mono/diheme cytochrome c family protein
VVSSDNVVYVNTWSGSYYPPNEAPPSGGFLVALQDTKGVGKADVIQRFGETIQSGGAGGTGIALYNGSLYAEINDKIVKYALPAGSIVPQGPPVTVVSGLPLGGDHPMHPFLIDKSGNLYVDVGTATNACQLQNRELKSPGAEPCKELETRGGIWRYDANKTGQTFSPADRYATGIRNGEGFAADPAGHLYVATHGRDQLHANWPDLYKPYEEATLPSEVLLLLRQGGDYGWPECYYDPGRNQLVLAPEYGGDGGKTVGVCASKIGAVAAFPAHWGPNGAAYYSGGQFPSSYHDGVFIAFHGSWDRAPYAQDGYNVVFQSLAEGKGSGRCEIFADGFAGADKSPGKAAHRPSGVAVGPDGALYVSDDTAGRIYKIVYAGGSGLKGDAAQTTPCPSLTASPGEVLQAAAQSSSDPTAKLPVPQGATHETVAEGYRIYHRVTCAACHGANGTGNPLGPDLTTKKWLWSDGTVSGIAKTITNGVPQPKQYRSPMPALGGAQLTPDQVKALAAYIWALSQQ